MDQMLIDAFAALVNGCATIGDGYVDRKAGGNAGALWPY